MKISKADHAITAVVKSAERGEQPEICGIIYDNPEKNIKEKKRSVEARVDARNKEAQSLYAILNGNVDLKFARTKDEKAYCGDVRKNFLWCVKELVKEECIKNQMKMLDQLLAGKDEKECKIAASRRKELIQSLVVASIRKSFRKEVMRKTEKEEIKVYLPDIVEKIILKMCRCGRDVSISDEEKKIFLHALAEDYARKEQIENIKKSIKCQNVKVQAKKVGGVVRLQLSNADHKRKKYIFEFIKEFASCRKEEQDRMFVYIKKLIILFYCGAEKYEQLEKDEKEVSGWGISLNEDACYCGEAKNLIEENKNCKDKLERKKRNEEIRKEIKSRILNSYKQGNAYLKEVYHVEKKPGLDDYERASYWLSYIEERAERLLLEKGKLYPKKKKTEEETVRDEKKTEEEAVRDVLSVQYLCEYTWKEWLSFICMKYMDMGKAVYHFAMPDLTQIDSKENVVIGEVQPQFRDGLTSFDYERIKAQESLDREISMYVTFAVNNFATAVLKEEKRTKGGEDVLNLPKGREGEYLRADCTKRILQFFGGKSRWIEDDKGDKSKMECLFWAVRQGLESVRNSCFHYTAIEEETESDKTIQAMFEKEFNEAGRVFRKKYYSNNVPMFYEVKEIDALMMALYNSPKDRPAQIPSYERILKRSEFANFLNGYKNSFDEQVNGYICSSGKQNINKLSTEDAEKFKSALYFVLKQIYYYGFLQDSGLKANFVKKVEDYKTKAEIAERSGKGNKQDLKKRKYAAASFKKRIDEMTGKDEAVTFGAICQQIMTDYNLQNNKEKKVEISRTDCGNKVRAEGEKLYDHYPLILQECIREAFRQYLDKDENLYGFLKNPQNKKECFGELSEEKFCQNWQVTMYDEIKGSGNLSWYTLAHFLNQRQLNRLIGTFKSHIQFVEDIDKREGLANEYTGNGRENTVSNNTGKYKKIVKMLEFSVLFCERMTNNCEDYFEDEEEYAGHLAKFVCFESKDLKGTAALKEFCEREVKTGGANGKIGIYYDAQNPVISRNVVKAMMYGNAKLLEACVEPITEEEIQDYYCAKSNLSKIFKAGQYGEKGKFEAGQCRTREDYISLREFQNKKNRIELTNVAFYMEVIDELMGQLISWAYLRERDLMYFQLGYYYTKIFHGDSIPSNDKRRSLKGDGFHIADGAVLYQIVAVNTYRLPVFMEDENARNGLVIPQKANVGIGGSLGGYAKMYTKDTYYAGRQLFERKNGRNVLDAEHDEIAEFRKYIDHFKYFSALDRSLMDLYSVMFDHFFSYNNKLHRSVPDVFQNILARYFVIADIDVGTKEMRSFKTKAVKNRACIVLRESRLLSDVFTYKVKEQKKMRKGKNTWIKTVDGKVYADARDEKFLSELRNILEYPKKK